MIKEAFETICDDGVILKGVLFIPKQPKAVIQFNCGTAVPKEFYYSFIRYLTEHNYLCCIWNYRGTNSSDNLKNCTYKYTDYGIKDMPAIKKYLQKKYASLPFLFVAHSAGGQQIGFIKNLENVKGAIHVAVSAGYYPNMPISYRLKAYFFFYFFSPLSVLLTKYVKAKPFGLMENLPKNIVYEWRNWLEKEDYFFDKKFYGKTVPIGHYQNFKFPMHVYYSVDDTISNKKNTQAFWRHVKSEKEITFTKLVPSEFDLKKIDHFGYFKKNMKKTLWKEIVQKLDNFLKK
ncbi:serine aminopeptidase domain-containing protein [Tenacibaculum sp. IB213877]|uniref:alpha/beta hydrolase family protein n=1 Tax=Tenacibaculum sp. IB213877 TaxID=3097351 RepID=UPI002A59F9A5|nr:alpha/beta hydrolase [Tenacibaculum sp. IB213877]MDY0779836.1 alpha/beta hydrolase [Tenacibaculum sp. IB213877]